MVSEYILTKIADHLFSKTKDFLEKKHQRTLLSTKIDFQKSLQFHLNYIYNWAEEISFKDLKKSKSLTKTYIDLDIYLTPLKRQYFKEEANQKVPIHSLLGNSVNHIVLLGQPGAGKTTSIKKICNEIFFNGRFGYIKIEFPIVIKTNELTSATGYSIIKKIANILDIKLQIAAKELKTVDEEVLMETIITVLNSVNAILIIDGLDELPNQTLKNDVIREIKALTLSLKSTRLLLTSRSGDYSINIENTTVFEICPLDQSQIIQFAQKWFENDDLSRNFLLEVEKSRYSDMLDRPIFISLLCSIFERLGKVPDKPKTVYRKAFSMLLEEWDEQRSIIRSSKYANLDIDVKLELLSQLAFFLTNQNNSLLFDRHTLKMFYKNVCDKYDLPKDEYFQVIEELESHHGIFIQDGYDSFKFNHKSMQEYLTAEYIKGFPNIPDDIQMIIRIPNEMAIAVTLSTKPTEYIVDLIFTILKDKVDSNFINPFITRLFYEKPSFEPDSYYALVIMYINDIIINSKSTNVYANEAIEHFLLSKEFKASFKELLTDSNFLVFASHKKFKSYHYSSATKSKYNLNFLYNIYLKLDNKYIE